MDSKKAGQIGTAGLVIGIVTFVATIVLGVYVLYYQPDSSSSDSSSDKKSYHYAPMSHAAPMSRPMAPVAPMAPMHPQQYQLRQAAYAAPPVPRAPPSGPVGTFFDDELPQA
jgi:hypothetical protein